MVGSLEENRFEVRIRKPISSGGESTGQGFIPTPSFPFTKIL